VTAPTTSRRIVNYRLTLPVGLHREALATAEKRGVYLAAIIRDLIFDYVNTANGCPQCGRDRRTCGHPAESPILKPGRRPKVGESDSE